MRRTGAEVVWESLRREGTDVVFGFPGGAIMATYHPREASGIRHVLVRHEQAAAHAADGYARVSGRVGVVLATSGPGATNLVTGIATAMMDSSPVVCITGQVRSDVIGTDAFQEADITGITLPITKHNYLVRDVDTLADTIHEAFYVARTGRPGPVLIDLPKDVQVARTSAPLPTGEPCLRGYRPCPATPDSDLQRAVSMIAWAQRPVILAGRGIILADASAVLRQFAEKIDAPVTYTLLGVGALPPFHPLSLGMMGMHGTAPANLAIQHADLLIALGMRFDDRVTGALEHYAPGARKIHVDLDPAELNKTVPVDVAIEGDVADVLARLVPEIAPVSHGAWRERIGEWKEEADARDVLHRPAEDRLIPPHVIAAIREGTRGEAIVVTDVGQHQMWTGQYYPCHRPRRFVTSGGLGTMGFGLSAAMGAQIAEPSAEVWAIVGDGGFQMSSAELATVVQEGLPLRIAVIDNGYLGMVRQWQEFFFDGHYESTRLRNPDFVRLAEAYGIPAWRAVDMPTCREAIRAARATRGPAFIDFQTVQEGEEGNVYPMVPSGAPLHEMIRRPVLAAVTEGV